MSLTHASLFSYYLYRKGEKALLQLCTWFTCPLSPSDLVRLIILTITPTKVLSQPDKNTTAALNHHYHTNPPEPTRTILEPRKDSLWQRSQESPLERAGLRLSYSSWFRPIYTPGLLKARVSILLVPFSVSVFKCEMLNKTKQNNISHWDTTLIP